MLSDALSEGLNQLDSLVTGTQRKSKSSSAAAEGDYSVVSALSTSGAAGAQAQCHCPCLGAGRSFCCSKIILTLGNLFKFFLIKVSEETLGGSESRHSILLCMLDRYANN